VSAARVWSSISAGLFLLAVAVLIQTGAGAKWILVVLCASSAVGALVKGWWRWAVHPLLWGAALADHFLHHRWNAWALGFGLLGASALLSVLVDIVPRRHRGPPPPPPPPRPGSGIVLEAEIR
jgi:hypothetical protein